MLTLNIVYGENPQNHILNVVLNAFFSFPLSEKIENKF
jgi:hypothetical protein